MTRRDVVGLAGAGLVASGMAGASSSPAFLEIARWFLHNSREDQSTRLTEFLENGLQPALSRGGAALVGVFGNVIGENGPYLLTLVQHSSLAGYQSATEKLRTDADYLKALDTLSSGPGLPFVRIESSLLRMFDVMPEPKVGVVAEGKTRIFELRTYESQSFASLRRKVKMFNEGEAQIFERVGARPVFFGETLVGPRQPNLTYMLSFDDVTHRDQIWKAFVNDPDWKRLSAQPELKDSEIVANISNVILRPLPFSKIR